MARTADEFLAERHGLELNDLGLVPGGSGLTNAGTEVTRIRLGDAFGPQTVTQIRIWGGFFEVLGSGGARRYYNLGVVAYFSPLVDGPIDSATIQ